MHLSQLAESIQYTFIPQLKKYAEQFENIVAYTMGEPDFPSPESVKNAIVDALEKNDTYYPETQGNRELRNLISEKYNNLYQTDLTLENVMITAGATGALYLTLLTLLSASDEVILLTPHYSNYIGQITSVGAKAKLVKLRAENNFAINLADIESAITEKTKVLLFNFPNNPLGTIIDEKTVLALGKLAKQYGLFIVSDEVYRTIVFENKHMSFMHPKQENLENTFIIDGVSKSYSMTGYRLGYIVSKNRAAFKAMSEFDDWIYGGVPPFIQQGAIAALLNEEAYSQKMRDIYQQRRNRLVEGINRIKGISCSMSQGTFYVFADISQTRLTSEDFVYKLLEQEQILIVPGINYGQAGDRFVRISYATSEENIDYLLLKLEKFMAQFH